MHCNPDLHAAVVAAPDDDAPRLVYADWLLSRGDPRGELIAVQIARARLAADDPAQRELAAHERALFEAHGEAWRAPYGGAWLAFERGFVTRVRCKARELGTLRGVLAGAEFGACVRALSVTAEHGAGDQVIAALRHVLPVVRLCELAVWGAELGGGFAELVAAPELAALEVFETPHPRLPQLVALRALPALRGLVFDTIFEETLDVLATWPRPLRRLEFARCTVGEAFAALLDRPAFARLERLAVRQALLGVGGAAAIVTSALPLVALDLADNALDPSIAELIADQPRFAALRQLVLTSTRIGEAGVAALIASPYLPRSLELVLDGELLQMQATYHADEYGGRVFDGEWTGPIRADVVERFGYVHAGDSPFR